MIRSLDLQHPKNSHQIKSDVIKHSVLNHSKIPRFRSECHCCSVCVFFFFLANFPLSSPLGPHHPTLHLNFSSCCRKRNCFLWVLVVMLRRGLETSLASSASSMLGDKTDEGLPKFGMPNFSKAWWRKVFWILEGSFFWQSVLASWPICFSHLWPCCCLFLLRAVSY